MSTTQVLFPEQVEQAGRGEHAVLTGPDGRAHDVPGPVHEVFLAVLAALGEGRAATVSIHGAELTTQQVADILGVSRPTVVRLLDSGEIPSTRPNRHRRVRLEDVVEYRARGVRDRRAALADMVKITEDLGLYSEDPPPIRR